MKLSARERHSALTDDHLSERLSFFVVLVSGSCVIKSKKRPSRAEEPGEWPGTYQEEKEAVDFCHIGISLTAKHIYLLPGQPGYYRSEALHLLIKQQDRGEAIVFSLLQKMFDGLIDAHRSGLVALTSCSIIIDFQMKG